MPYCAHNLGCLKGANVVPNVKYKKAGAKQREGGDVTAL